MAKKKHMFSAEEIAVFCEQISLILSSGIPLYEGIEALAGDYAGTQGEAAFAAMNEEMKQSGSFAAAIEAAQTFPPYMTGMVRVGEESGQLDTLMQKLAEHYMQEAQLKSSALNAVRYPLTLMAVMALVITVLVFQVMPVFENAFMSLSGGLNGTSAVMLKAGQAAGIAVFAVMAALLLVAAALLMMAKRGKAAGVMAKVCAMVKPLAVLRRRISAQRFASVLSMLLSGGFPMDQALELMPAVFDAEEEKALMRKAGRQVLEGMPVSAVIEETGLFDPLHLRMIRVGFAYGQADEALGRVSGLITQEIDSAMGRMIALIEPALVVVLSAMIGAILLSVMMPLAGVLSAMA